MYFYHCTHRKNNDRTVYFIYKTCNYQLRHVALHDIFTLKQMNPEDYNSYKLILLIILFFTFMQPVYIKTVLIIEPKFTRSKIANIFYLYRNSNYIIIIFSVSLNFVKNKNKMCNVIFPSTARL